jgi:hypothetical protein
MIRRLLLIGAGFALFFATAYFASVSALAPVRQEALAQPRIFAYRGWQSMGVQLNEGDIVTIRARGEWLYTPGEYHGPEGHARFPAPSFYPLSNPTGGYERMRAVPGGVLIGRIGENGSPFLVGRGTTRRASERGTLYLRINDDKLTDNEGWVAAEVRVETPEAEAR